MVELLDAVRDPADDRPHIGGVRFDHATFEGGAWVDGATFEGKAAFDWATFKGDAGFDEATFKGHAEFYGVTFEGHAWFHSATFESSAHFSRAIFEDGAGFYGVTFEGLAWAGGATFKGDAAFDWATFKGDAGFDEATFTGDVSFHAVTFENDVRFYRAAFEAASRLGPLVCRGAVRLADAVFSVAVIIEIAARRVDCRGTRWGSAAALRLRRAAIDLSDAVLEFPVSVTAAHPEFIALSGEVLNDPGPGGVPVRVVSLRGVDASHLVLTDVDLSECHFAGTIHLDQLRLHGRCPLASAPSGLHRRGPLPVRLTPRQTLAEEQHWRAACGRAGAVWQPAPDGIDSLEPAALAPIYRELRKGSEDAKNEPGAVDFYYGEMEMRRHDQHTPAAERVLLWLYWAVSGYGLRASRALGWLLVAMTVTVILMVGFGLPDTPAQPYPPGAGVIGKQNPQLHADFTDRITSARAQKAADVVINSVVFRSSGQQLTTAGRYIERASRFTEPALLVLALLAVRGRVKR